MKTKTAEQIFPRLFERLRCECSALVPGRECAREGTRIMTCTIQARHEPGRHYHVHAECLGAVLVVAQQTGVVYDAVDAFGVRVEVED